MALDFTSNAGGTIACGSQGGGAAVRRDKETGYPFSVHLGRGYPRYNPGEVDACVLVGSAGVAAFTTAVYGVHRRGTAYRMDEVSIPLRTFLTSDYPSDGELLRAIEAAL